MADENPFLEFYERGGYLGTPDTGKRLRQAIAAGGIPETRPVPPFVEKGTPAVNLADAMAALHRACGGRE